MKIVSAKSFFKKARTGVNAGVKREDLTWTFEAIDASDVATLPDDQVARMINGVIESFGRKLIATNSDDWNFTVSGAECNFAAAYADMIEERKSGGRILTKDSLSKFADVYVSVMVAGGIPAKAAATVAMLIKEKFVSVAGKVDVVAALAGRMNQFCELASDEDLEPVAEVADALISLLDELSKPQEVTLSDI